MKFFLVNDFEAITLAARPVCLPSLTTPKGTVHALHSIYPHMLLEQHNFNTEMKYRTPWLAKYFFKWYTTLLDLLSMKRSQAEAPSQAGSRRIVNLKIIGLKLIDMNKWVSLECSILNKHAEN